MPNILILGQDEDFLSVVSSRLEIFGYKAKVFQRPDDLISYLQIESVPLLLYDIAAFEETGLEVLGQIKAVSEITVIAISGQDDPGYIGRIFEAGAKDYVVKPCNFGTLMDKIRKGLITPVTKG